MSLTVRELQIDVPADAFDATLAFWASALAGDPVPAPDDDRYVHLRGARSVVEVHLQRLDAGTGRYHLDLAPAGPSADPDAIDAEVARLVEIGASSPRPDDEGWTVLRSPAGLLLCVVPAGAPASAVGPRVPGTGYLDAVFVDVPDDVFDAELTFWVAALGGRIMDPPAPDSPYRYVGDLAAAGGRLSMAVQRVGAPARHHVDLSVADVATEVRRLEALGARRIAEIDTWITLADPAGNLFCVVPERTPADNDGSDA
jgi:hypothetical protein